MDRVAVYGIIRAVARWLPGVGNRKQGVETEIEKEISMKQK